MHVRSSGYQALLLLRSRSLSALESLGMRLHKRYLNTKRAKNDNQIHTQQQRLNFFLSITGKAVAILKKDIDHKI